MRTEIGAFIFLGLAATNVAAGPVAGQGTWQSTLHPRDLDGNPATVEAWYDSALNITWLADANYALTTGQPGSGSMYWDAGMAWVAGLDPYGSGITGWRLPLTVDTGAPGCDYANGGTDCGYNVDPATSEMAYLFYVELGDKAVYDSGGHVQAGSGFTNTGPFRNTVPPGGLPPVYWSATEYVVNTLGAWSFDFSTGYQGTHLKAVLALYLWPVHAGDVGTPVPATDTDGDGLLDVIDDCKAVANATQLDTDGDGYGNACDPDFNNDGVVNINDFNRLKSRLGVTPVTDPVVDLDGNGAVNINDLNRLKSYLGKPPGPSGLHPNCPPTCP